jgi:type I restriction enzyme S subunit
MKVKSVSSRWIYEEGLRLDSGPYMSGALEAKMLLEKLSSTQNLHEVTFKGKSGIFHAGRKRRHWVDNSEYGIPFLSSSDILKADLSRLPFISKKQIENTPEFLIHEGWTLVTRSGTIGRMTIARQDMDGLACSEHVMRIVPDKDKILPGYLYTYLSSRFGVPLVVSGTYGSIIQSIEPEHVYHLPVPRFKPEIENNICKLADNAASNRVKASSLLNRSLSLLKEKLGLKEIQGKDKIFTYQNSHSLRTRLDAFYFSEANKSAKNIFESTDCLTRLEEVSEVFIPNIFKRRYADDPTYGYPYITGADVFELAPTSDKYLMKTVAKENQLVLEKGMILIQEAGQLSGLIGHSVQVGSYLNGFACTNNMVRVTPFNPEDRGYIFTVLSSEYGVRLIQRESAGSSIPHIEVSRVQNLEIPWPDAKIRRESGKPAMEAQDLRDEACELENQARALVEKAIEEAA